MYFDIFENPNSGPSLESYLESISKVLLVNS